MSSIRILPSTLINQIAAGEVIEAPFSAMKELVENAIDAQATKVEVHLRHGGKSFIQVKDNGIGLSPEDMALALERHATSKLAEEDLFNIHTFGFRGEALPSIASVSRLTLHSGDWQFSEGAPIPAPHHHTGTIVEVADLFYRTPARLKFLGTDAAEFSHCMKAFKQLALTHHGVSFSLWHNGQRKVEYPSTASRQERVAQIMPGLLWITYQQNDFSLEGGIGDPLDASGNRSEQCFFVNHRPVRDKMFPIALKLAYGDRLPDRRYPSVCLYLNVHPMDVDVNVHPAKTEVRFRDPLTLRQHMIAAVARGLGTVGPVAGRGMSMPVRPVATEEVGLVYDEKPSVVVPFRSAPVASFRETMPVQAQTMGQTTAGAAFKARPDEGLISHLPMVGAFEPQADKDKADKPKTDEFPSLASLPQSSIGFLGYAKTQLFQMYIISQAEDKVYIIDQHAAHERVLYEQYKTQTFTQQLLLQPMAISMVPEGKGLLAEMGVVYEDLGPSSDGMERFLVKSLPSILTTSTLENLLAEAADVLESEGVTPAIYKILATCACHNSIRAGQTLSLPEMNALLRQIEATPNGAFCNHGRPTYGELTKMQLDTWFERR